MAKILRKTFVQFGSGGPTSSFGQFGSKTAGFPQTTKDPAVIQQLTAWVDGWQNAVVTANKAPYLEDMNGWCFVMSYMTAYLFQQGIPEWDSATTYYINSVVQANNGQWFNSLQDNNLNNPPPVGASNAFWTWINPPPPPIVPQVPVGTIIDHAGGPIPTGFLICDASAVSRITYAALFAQIGVIWGTGDGVNTFNIPNLQRRTTIGSGGSGTLVIGHSPGNTGGEETHTLIIAEMPAHTHSYLQVAANAVNVGGGSSYQLNVNATTGSTGGGGPHNIIQPSAVVNKLIKF